MHGIKYILRENIEIFSKQGRDLKKGKEEKNTVNQLNTELHCVFRKSLCAGTGVLEGDAAVPKPGSAQLLLGIRMRHRAKFHLSQQETLHPV